MSAEAIAIVGVGVALLAVLVPVVVLAKCRRTPPPGAERPPDDKWTSDKLRQDEDGEGFNAASKNKRAPSVTILVSRGRIITNLLGAQR